MLGNSKETKKLTTKEDLFIDEYIEDYNATRAYIKAYDYKGTYRNARSNASKVLKKAYIQEELKKRRQEMREEHDIYMESLIEQLKRIAFNNPKDLVNVKKNVVIINDTDELPDYIWTTIKSIKEGKNGIEIEFHDKMKAIELLVKYCGLYNEKLDVSGEIKYDFSSLEGLSLEQLNQIAGVGEWDSLPKGDEKDG